MKRMSTILLVLLPAAFGLGGLDDGLVANWQFEGNYQDSHGSHDLTNGGNVSLVAGRLGQAAAFDGTGDAFLTATAGSGLAVGEGSFTIAMWIKPDAGFTNGRLADARGTGKSGQYPGWQFRLRNLGTDWEFRGSLVDDGQGNAKNCGGCGATYPLDEWVHVAMVYRADQAIEFYVNGALDGSKTVPALGSLDNLQPFALGASVVKNGVLQQSGSQRYSGLMDEVRLYHRALSSSEVFGLYGMPIEPQGAATTEMFVDFLGERAGANHILGFFYLDSDTNGNGLPDFMEVGADDDLDGDGIANHADDDDDGDGIADLVDLAGYNQLTGTAAGRAPAVSASMPASFFQNGEVAANAGFHPGDYWQFVPNGIHEQNGAAYVDSQSRSYAGIYLNPAAYLYIDEYDRFGALASDGVPDILQAPSATTTLPPYVLDKDHETQFVDGSNKPGLLGGWNSGSTGATIFLLCDDDTNLTTSVPHGNYYPYSPAVTDDDDQADGQPDYDLYGTTDENDPAIPDELEVDDGLGVRLWRYRKLVGTVSDARELVYFLPVFWPMGGNNINSWYSRAEFNENVGNFTRNANTSGDEYGLDAGQVGVGLQTPDNWFPHFRDEPDHDVVAQYAFGLDWADIATTPYDGSAPIAHDSADQPWVDAYENFGDQRRVVNHVDLATNLLPHAAGIDTLLSGRYDIDLSLLDNRLILRREAQRNPHAAIYAVDTDGYLLSWEDFYATGDRNFADLVFFTNRPPTFDP